MIRVDKPTDVESKVKVQIEIVIDNSSKEFERIVSKLADEILGEMYLNAPTKTGVLDASLAVMPSKKNIYFKWVGPRYANRRSYNKGEGGNHAHLVEYGTKERYMKKGLLEGGFTRESGGSQKFKGKYEHKPFAGKYTGIMTAKPFIRPTYDKMGSYILATLKKLTEQVVKEQANKQGI